MQIMAEADAGADSDASAAAGLGDADIEQDVYEGGFKSWEGALDLARLMLERGPRKDIDELSRVDSLVEVRRLLFPPPPLPTHLPRHLTLLH